MPHGGPSRLRVPHGGPKRTTRISARSGASADAYLREEWCVGFPLLSDPFRGDADGRGHLRIIEEPIAAAIAYRLDEKRCRPLLGTRILAARIAITGSMTFPCRTSSARSRGEELAGNTVPSVGRERRLSALSGPPFSSPTQVTVEIGSLFDGIDYRCAHLVVGNRHCPWFLRDREWERIA